MFDFAVIYHYDTNRLDTYSFSKFVSIAVRSNLHQLKECGVCVYVCV